MAINAVATPPRATTPKRTSEEMLFLGQRCNHDACSLVDFLPLKCQYCNLAFCSSHHVTTFSPLASPSRPGHVCSQSPPPHALDRTTPLCPLCSLPVSIPLRPDGTQEDPNGPMERHIANACKGVDGKKEEMKRRRENGEICWRRGCGKGLVVKIRCDACNHQFCPTHRYPKDHSCQSFNSTSSSTVSLPKLNSTTPSSTTNSVPPHLFGARKEAALAAMKRFGHNVGSGSGSTSGNGIGSGSGDAKTAVKSTTTTSTPTVAAKAVRSSSSTNKPLSEPSTTQKLSTKLGISPDEKRRRAELASQYESLKHRHEKGLLNPAEKVRYAELVAEKESSRRKGDGDCVIA